jgi:hypothetical protein
MSMQTWNIKGQCYRIEIIAQLVVLPIKELYNHLVI